MRRITYAQHTTINEDKSRLEIERLLMKQGCQDIASRRSLNFSAIACVLHDRQLRFTLRLPTLDDYLKTDKGRRRSHSQAQVARDQDIRRRWRSLAFVIKAHFVEVADGIAKFDDAFMQYIVLPNGQTVAEWMVPQIEQIYLTGQMPSTLIALPAPQPEGQIIDG